MVRILEASPGPLSNVLATTLWVEQSMYFPSGTLIKEVLIEQSAAEEAQFLYSCELMKPDIASDLEVPLFILFIQ